MPNQQLQLEIEPVALGFQPLLTLILCAFLVAPSPLWASSPRLETSQVVVPRLSAAPKIQDFLEMKPNGAGAAQMAKVSDFVQIHPYDGQPAKQRTEVYLGYDEKNLYVVWVCFDEDSQQVRGQLARRGDVAGDDRVELTLDTFQDQRRGYVFLASALGTQWDAIWTEGPGYDSSFETVWHSRGERTDQGYVVWMAIPFRSLRFAPHAAQSWGALFFRHIPRTSETSAWPPISSRVQGRLNQAAQLTGLDGVSPGRNMQFIPYAAFRSFRALDLRDPLEPVFARTRGEGDIGLDAKFVLRDSLVLDFALNPDFAHVESDEPQVTANQRFEVFFPERRPFFLENSGYFRTPIDLLFTRRIADPQFGARLTGKTGPWGLGVLLADDQSPGRLVPPGHPLAGQRAHFGIARVSRDILEQSSIGAIYTERRFQDSWNRVGGIDSRIKLGQNWVATGQALSSATMFPDGGRHAGPAYAATVQHIGRHLLYEAVYHDRSPGFVTQTGFVPRVDLREIRQYAGYQFRPEKGAILGWGGNVNGSRNWDKSGERLDERVGIGGNLQMRQVRFFITHSRGNDRLRPRDFVTLDTLHSYSISDTQATVSSDWTRFVSVSGTFGGGQRINFVPPAGQPPTPAQIHHAFLELKVQPGIRLQIHNTYRLARLRDQISGRAVFSNHIMRTRWNWQLNRELSLRFIGEYNALLTNAGQTLLDTRKNLNFDFLVTYYVHPGTALYVGYNSNLQNLYPDLRQQDGRLLRPQRSFMNDGRQFFAKISYLLRF